MTTQTVRVTWNQPSTSFELYYHPACYQSPSARVDLSRRSVVSIATEQVPADATCSWCEQPIHADVPASLFCSQELQEEADLSGYHCVLCRATFSVADVMQIAEEEDGPYRHPCRANRQEQPHDERSEQ